MYKKCEGTRNERIQEMKKQNSHTLTFSIHSPIFEYFNLLIFFFKHCLLQFQDYLVFLHKIIIEWGEKKIREYKKCEKSTMNVRRVWGIWRKHDKWKKIVIPSSHSSYPHQFLNILIFFVFSNIICFNFKCN